MDWPRRLQTTTARSDLLLAVIFDSTTRHSTPESGASAGCDGYKCKKESKVHLAVDTLHHLLALRLTTASA